MRAQKKKWNRDGDGNFVFKIFNAIFLLLLSLFSLLLFTSNVLSLRVCVGEFCCVFSFYFVYLSSDLDLAFMCVSVVALETRSFDVGFSERNERMNGRPSWNWEIKLWLHFVSLCFFSLLLFLLILLVLFPKCTPECTAEWCNCAPVNTFKWILTLPNHTHLIYFLPEHRFDSELSFNPNCTTMQFQMNVCELGSGWLAPKREKRRRRKQQRINAIESQWWKCHLNGMTIMTFASHNVLNAK